MVCIVCAWHLSLNVAFVGFSYGHSFLSLYGISLHTYNVIYIAHYIYISLHIYFNSCVHSTSDRQLGCFQFGTVTNNASVTFLYMSLGAHVHVFLLGINLGVELLGHRVYL